MTDDKSDMDHSNGEQTVDPNSNSIPGGKQQKPLEEPESPEVLSSEEMGCAGSTVNHNTTEDDQKKSPKSRDSQRKIDDFFHPNQNNKAVSPKKTKIDDNNVDSNKQSKSRTTVHLADDEDDNENKYRQRQTGPVTRSLANLPQLRIKFEDSDDDNSSSSSWAQRDIADYRNGYPYAQQNRRINDNYEFYTNQIRSHPDGDYIDNIHKKWFGDYRKLEYHHGYIQWLFPLQEKGLNWSAEPLQKHEIELIKEDKAALKRILKSYKLMLDFYGFQLESVETGELRRLPGDDYKDRFRNLNTSPHNYLRITRILKCLGEFNYEYLKLPFLETILYESIIEGTLTNCLRSCKDYWIGTLRLQEERRAIRQYARELLKYREKGNTPPPSHHALRPSATIKQTKKTHADGNAYHEDDME